MKLGDSGEAFFVQELESDEVSASSLVTPLGRAWGLGMLYLRGELGGQRVTRPCDRCPIQPPGLFSRPPSPAPALLHRKTCLPACARHPSLGEAWRGSLRTPSWAPPASQTPAPWAWPPAGGRRNGAGGKPSGRRALWRPILVQRSWRRALGVSHPCWKSQGQSPQGMYGAAGAGTPPGVQAQFPLLTLCDPAQGTCPVSDCLFPCGPLSSIQPEWVSSVEPKDIYPYSDGEWHPQAR